MFYTTFSCPKCRRSTDMMMAGLSSGLGPPLAVCACGTVVKSKRREWAQSCQLPDVSDGPKAEVEAPERSLAISVSRSMIRRPATWLTCEYRRKFMELVEVLKAFVESEFAG